MIGELNEKSIHSTLKNYYEKDKSKQEVRILGYIADIVNENGITEIQTSGFDKLKDKLSAYGKERKVNIVYPVSIVKHINWIDPATNTIISRNKSSRRGSVMEIFNELYKIRYYLKQTNINFIVVLLESEEYKLLDGYGTNHKKRATKVDKVPTKIINSIEFSLLDGYNQFLPDNLKDKFTSDEYAKVTKCKLEIARKALLILNELEIVQRIGKEGRNYLYSKR